MYGRADSWKSAGDETGLGTDASLLGSDGDLLHSAVSAFNDGLRRTAWANMAAQDVKVEDVVAGGAFVNCRRSDGSAVKHVAVGSELYDLVKEGVWIKIEADGPGWTAAGLASHAADDSMSPVPDP